MMDPREKSNMVVYQFEVDDQTWRAWKDTVPRSKPLDERLRELIEADTAGRVESSNAEPDSTDVNPTFDADKSGSNAPGSSDAADVGAALDPDGDTSAWAASVVAKVADGWADDPRLENRKAAAREILIHAAEDGAVGKSDPVVDEIRDRHPVDGQDRETYWRKNLRPALKAAGSYSQGEHGYVVKR